MYIAGTLDRAGVQSGLERLFALGPNKWGDVSGQELLRPGDLVRTLKPISGADQRDLGVQLRRDRCEVF